MCVCVAYLSVHVQMCVCVSVLSCGIRVVFAYKYYTYILCFSLSKKSTSGSCHQTLSGINHSTWRSSTPMTSLYMYTDCLCCLPTLVDACKLYLPDRCVTYRSLLSMRKLSSCDYYEIMKCNFSAMINCMYNVYMYSTMTCIVVLVLRSL